MKNFYILFFLFILLSHHSESQIFQHVYGGTSWDRGMNVHKDSNGGYIIGGYTASFGAGVADYYLVKTDIDGNMVWSGVYGGTGTEYQYSICHNSDGSHCIAGRTNSYGAGGYDFWVIRVNSTGGVIWAKTYGTASNEYAYNIKQTSTGDFIVVGNTSNITIGAGCFDVLLMKLDINGNPIWQNTFGLSGCEYPLDVEETGDGGFIVTGSSGSTGGAGSNDVFLLKVTSLGNFSWWKFYGGIGGDRGNDVVQTPDGGYLVSCVTNSYGSGGDDLLLIKTNSSGTLDWAKCYGGTGNEAAPYSNYPTANAMTATSDGNFVVASSTYSFGAGSADGYLFKINDAGTLLWDSTYGSTGAEFFDSVEESAGTLIMGGSRTSAGGAGSYDMWFTRTSGTGQSGCEQSTASTIVVDISLSIIVGSPAAASQGSMSVSASQTPIISAHTTIDNSICILPLLDITFKDVWGINKNKENHIYWNTLTDAFSQDMYVVQKSKDGIQFENLTRIAANSSSVSSSIEYHIIDPNPFEGINFYRIKFEEEMKKEAYSKTIQILNVEENKIIIYPNPAQNQIHLLATTIINERAVIRIYNVIGKIVLEQKRTFDTANEIQIDIGALPQGVYILKYGNGLNKTQTFSFIKQ